MKSFGQRLKEARQNKGLTQKQLADLIKAKHNSVSNWENDQNRPDADTLGLICERLDVTPTHLLSNELTLGNRIEFKRHSLGLSQKELAAAVNLTEDDIKRYEQDDITDIIEEKVYAIAEKLNTTFQYLTGQEGTVYYFKNGKPVIRQRLAVGPSYDEIKKTATVPAKMNPSGAAAEERTLALLAEYPEFGKLIDIMATLPLNERANLVKYAKLRADQLAKDDQK